MKKQTFPFFATCPRGLEQILATELVHLKAQDVTATDGGVAFNADWLTMMAANVHSRVASRILWKLAERPYRNEDDVYQLVRSVEWYELFDVSKTIKVSVTAIKSPLKSLDFLTLKIKDAVCDRFRAKLGERPSVDTREPAMRIQAFLTDSMASVYLDTSGEALFKRGYRVASGEAPLRENLAAGILKLTGWDGVEPLFDPMCGSGTFLVEAAMIALNIPPGLNRYFAFEQFKMFVPAALDRVREAAKAGMQPLRPLPIFGNDIDRAVLETARENLEAAGLADCVDIWVDDALTCEAPMDHGVLVCNPPYGIRLDEQEHLGKLYPEIGHALKQRFSGWRAYYFTGDLRLAKLIRLSASKRTVLFNGALECRLFEFKMVAGSNRKAEE
ncbi:class I SAM-dependent RNA methyltransferase [Burkholderiaceae bacterium DAT-1]|nr:class I SAM-dependent RNA methyltransferase [Burkholderiaceae bacterium DAT-1]